MTTNVEEVVEEVSPGWHIRRAAEGDDWSAIEGRAPGKLYWVRYHTDGRVTRVCASPGQTLKAAAEMDEPAAAPETASAEDTRQKTLADLETAQLARRARLHELTEKAVADVWLPEEESEELERLGGEYEGAYEAAVRALDDAAAVQEVRDRVEGAFASDEAPGSDAVADTDAADTSEADEEVGQGEGQPDDFSNPGAGFSRGLSSVALFDLGGDTPAPLSQQIEPARITRHPATLMRAAGLDPDHVEELRGVLREGRRFKDPVEAYFDGVTYWLAEGNHRHEAATLEGALLDVNVHGGGLREAIVHAARANAEHGLKRSNDDKRLAVVMLLLDEEIARESDTTIGDMAGRLSQPFVGKVQGWLMRLMPLLAEDVDGELSDEELSHRSGAPAGLVSIVRSLPGGAEARATLSHNVMARAESRTSKDGKQFSVERAAPDEPLPLLAGVDVPQEAAGDAQESPDAAEEPAAEATPAPAPEEERGGEKIVVNDRRRFADDLPAHVTSTAAPSLPAREGAGERVAQGTGEQVTPAPQAEPAPSAPLKSAAPKPDRLAELEKRLAGRALSVTHTLMPRGLGVQVTVNLAGASPSDAVNSKLYPAEKVMPLGEVEFELASQRLDAEKLKPKAAAKKAGAKSSKKGAASKAPGAAKGKEWDKSPLNPARFKKGSKVAVRLKGALTQATVVGVSPEDNRKLRVAVGNKTHDYFVAQLPVGEAGSKKAAKKGGK